MNPLEALHLQLRLEGKEVLNGDLLRQVEVVPDEEMPLVVIASLSSQELVVYYDEALSPELRDGLGKQVRSVDFPNIDPIIAALHQRYLKLEIGRFKTYIFPERYKDLIFDEVTQFHNAAPKVQAFGFDGLAEQVHAVERDGKIVSACVSAKENDRCGEAWVTTDPEYRHQGFARKVVGAWAKSLLAMNKVPFYSHKIDNIASAQLAKRLGLEPVFEEIVIAQSS
jgi:RimJ/RimL family protein N-acetyltransferase